MNGFSYRGVVWWLDVVASCSLCLSVALSQTSRADLTDGLVGYWPLDALDASDASGNGLDGLILGDLGAAEDRFGDLEGAVYFPGQTRNHRHSSCSPSA